MPGLASTLLLAWPPLLLVLILLPPLPASAAWQASAQGVAEEEKGRFEEAAPLTEGGLGQGSCLITSATGLACAPLLCHLSC